MKYLRSFIESKSFLTYKELIEEIKDILLPISDLGYNIEVKLVKDYDYFIFINIITYDDDPLEMTTDIKDDIDRLYEFTKENGFEIKRVYYKLVESDGRIFNRSMRDIVSYTSISKIIKDKKIAFLSLELKQIEK